MIHPQHGRRLSLAHAGVDELFRPLAASLYRQLKFLWLDEALADEMADLLAYGDKHFARQFGECVVDAVHAARGERGVNELTVAHCAVSDVRFVKELYPRLKPNDETIERYRDAIDGLPPIVIARDGVLVDGYHRWQAFTREGRETISAIDLGNLSDAEIMRESIMRNASHGQQLSKAEKQRLAGGYLWTAYSHLGNGERIAEIANILAVSQTKIKEWTKEARQGEKEAAQAKAWDLWLDCLSERQIAETVGVTQPTVGEWVKEKVKSDEFFQPPESRQHFDVWQFATADKTAGAQSYFGALPPQVIENLLWFFTEPGDVVVDLFAGSGTTVDVAKAMGRRVWASDIRGNHYSPTLPIHEHDGREAGAR